MIRPEGLAELRREAEYRAQRLRRLEHLAEDGRVNFETFAEARAYAQGWADALAHALELVVATSRSVPLDMAVIELAQQGLDVEVIANRCGVALRDVAESLARYARAGADINQEGGKG